MYIAPNQEMKEIGMEEGLAEIDAERGYGIFNFDGTGILEISRYDCMYVGTGIEEYNNVTDEDCAVHAHNSGYCKIIPVEELPEYMIYEGCDRRYYGYVDNPENRERIQKFYEGQNKKIKIHARVTREIEISLEQAETLVNYLCASTDNNDITGICNQFSEGIDPGNYAHDAGYLPYDWLIADLTDELSKCTDERGRELLQYLNANLSVVEDFDL